MNQAIETMYVYALIGKDSGIVYYVGQTVSLYNRERHHFENLALKINEPLTFKVIETTDSLYVNEREREAIKLFRENGQCKLNKTKGNRSKYKANTSGSRVLCVESGRIFHSKSMAARYFNVSGATICNVLNKYKGKIDNNFTIKVI